VVPASSYTPPPSPLPGNPTPAALPEIVEFSMRVAPFSGVDE
jgi:hypothetical protein